VLSSRCRRSPGPSARRPPQRSIGPTVQRERERRRGLRWKAALVQRRMAARGAAAIDRATAGDEKPDDVRAPIGARSGSGCVDRQVTFAVAVRLRARSAPASSSASAVFPVAEVRREMQRRPAVVAHCRTAPGSSRSCPPHVRIEPECASFEQVRASAAIEEQTGPCPACRRTSP